MLETSYSQSRREVKKDHGFNRNVLFEFFHVSVIELVCSSFEMS